MLFEVSDSIYFYMDEKHYQLSDGITKALKPYVDESLDPQHALPVHKSVLGLLEVYCNHLNIRGCDMKSFINSQYLLLILTDQIRLTPQEFESLLTYADSDTYPAELLLRNEISYLASLVTHVEKVYDTSTKVSLSNPISVPATWGENYFYRIGRFCSVESTKVILNLEDAVRLSGYPEPNFYNSRMYKYLSKAFDNRVAFHLLLALHIKESIEAIRYSYGVQVEALLGAVEENPAFVYTSLVNKDYYALEEYLGI